MKHKLYGTLMLGPLSASSTVTPGTVLPPPSLESCLSRHYYIHVGHRLVRLPRRSLPAPFYLPHPWSRTFRGITTSLLGIIVILALTHCAHNGGSAQDNDRQATVSVKVKVLK